MSEINFDEIQQKILDKETEDKKRGSNWIYYKDEWSIKRKAFAELKSLYEKLGGDQFMKLASSTILFDSAFCDPYPLFGLLPESDNIDELVNQYEEELAEVNKKFLSKFIVNADSSVHSYIIEYLVGSIGTETISKEFIDALRLNPDSTLFSKENIEAYGESLKDGDWTKELEQDSNDKLIREALEMANDYAIKENYYDAKRMYENAIEMIQNNDLLLIDTIFKKLLCVFVTSSMLDYEITKLSDKYPIFKESKQYAYLQIVKKVVEITFDRDLKIQYETEFNEATDKYLDNNVVDPITNTLFLKIKDKYQ